MIRAVLDTNILVRAVLQPRGTVGFVTRGIGERRFTVLYSDTMLEELTDVLARPRFRTKYGVSDEDVRTLVGTLLHYGEAVEPTGFLTVCRDPKDDKFLDVAVEGGADVIVTGDEDLLVLHPFKGIPIVGPASFEEMLLEAETGEM